MLEKIAERLMLQRSSESENQNRRGDIIKHERLDSVLSTAVTMVLSLVIFGALSVNGATYTWDNDDDDNEFSSSANWNPDNDPVGSNVGIDGSFGSLTDSDMPIIDSSFTSSSNSVPTIDLGNGGQLDIQSGTNYIDTFRLGHVGTISGTGTVNHSGGTVNSGSVSVGVGSTYSMSGSAELNITDTINRGRMILKAGKNTGSATFEISGGSFSLSPQGPYNLMRRGGQFRVKGSGASSITIDSTYDNPFYMLWDTLSGYNHTNKLDMQIDSGGVTAIDTNGTDVAIHGAANNVLDVSFLEGSDRAGTWEVLSWEGNLIDENDTAVTDESTANSLLPFASGVNPENWEKAWSGLDNNSDGGSLSVTYVPEPSSLLLLGLSSLLLLKRRRRA